MVLVRVNAGRSGAAVAAAGGGGRCQDVEIRIGEEKRQKWYNSQGGTRQSEREKDCNSQVLSERDVQCKLATSSSKRDTHMASRV